MNFGLPHIDPATAGTMLQSITGSSQDPQIILGTFLVVFARLIGFLVVAPFFGSMNIPMTARVALAVVLSIVIAPFVQDAAAPAIVEAGSTLGLSFGFLMINQIFIGLMMGFAGSFVFYAVESAGRIIDTQRGSNITDIIAPQTGERTSPIGQFLMMFALMLLITTGMQGMILESFIKTFHIFPPTSSLDWVGYHGAWGKSVVKHFADLSGYSLVLTVQIAAPAMISLLLTDVLLGIINRGAPQVNVFVLSQVVKGPIGIASVLIAIIPISNYLQGTIIPGIAHGPNSIEAIARIMAGA